MMINGCSARSKKTGHKKNALLPLNDFINVAPNLIEYKQLLQGWISINKIYWLQEIYAASTQVVRQIILANSADPANILDFFIRHILQEDTLASLNHVSAIDLSYETPPKSLKSYHALPVNNKAVWDMEYEEEYYGIHNKTKTWTYISEEEYQQLKLSVGNTLPTIHLAVIKTDANGKPQWAKYRICVMGNLDPTNWSCNKVFAPVLSHLKICLLVTIDVQERCKVNSGDLKQAFCQAYFPDGEKYVLRLPKDYPITPPNTHFGLIWTLYVLKRIPRHWYKNLRATFLAIVLKQNKNSPCIFSGSIMPGHPPICVGLSVDEFIYFSASEVVKTEFYQRIKDNKQILLTLKVNPQFFRHEMAENRRQWEPYHSSVARGHYQRASGRTRPIIY